MRPSKAFKCLMTDLFDDFREPRNLSSADEVAPDLSHGPQGIRHHVRIS